jgi:lysozyme
MNMQLSSNGLQLIKSFEGFRASPYADSAGIPTIGYGTILYTDGECVTMDDSAITEAQAEQYLAFQINHKTSSVNQMLVVEVNQNQFDALVSFAYNLGVGALHGSTLLRLINASNFDGAADEFPKWDKADGQVIAGLTRRRLAEQQLFSTPV